MNKPIDALETLARKGARPGGCAEAATSCSIVIPASNEAGYIAASLRALLASETGDRPIEVVVVANGCSDDTVGVARRFEAAADARGWRLTVLDVAEGGKLNALNVGDAVATGDIRIYLDADVHVGPTLVAELTAALDRPTAAYASGRPATEPSSNWITRAYTRTWRRVPFMTDGVPGCCVFAVNTAGRARWGDFPSIIADDTFVRLQFAPHERIGVNAGYSFPMPDGFARLIRLRARQDFGAREVVRLYPNLALNDDKSPVGPARVLRMAASDPLGVGVYCAVAITARLRARRFAGVWVRARQP